MEQYRCEHFAIYELVDPATYNKYGQKAWEFLNPRLLKALDALREELGRSIIINDWKWGGKYKWSGLRTSACKIGAKMSSHRFGDSADIKVKGMSPDDVRAVIKKKYKQLGITAIELNTSSWSHISTQNCKGLKMFNP